MIMYSDLSDVVTCFALVSDVIVRESSESGCPLAVIVKPLYHPNGLLLTSYPRFARSCSRVFRTLRAASQKQGWLKGVRTGIPLRVWSLSSPAPPRLRLPRFRRRWLVGIRLASRLCRTLLVRLSVLLSLILPESA